MHQLIRYLSLCALLSLLSPFVLAQDRTRDMAKEKAIRQELESISPRAAADFDAATEALDKGDFQESARLFQDVMKKAPQFDVVYRRLGTALVLLGRKAEGMPLLEKAVQMKRSPENLINLAELLAYPEQGKEGNPVEKERALSLAVEAEANHTDNHPEYSMLVAQLSLDLKREQSFRKATQNLVSKHPGLMPTHYFNAVLAATDEDWVKAEEEIKLAEKMGLNPEAVKQFLDSGVHTRAMVWRYFYYALYLVAIWAVGLVLLFILGKVLSSVTLRSLENANPNDPTSESQVSLRKFYKRVINCAGFYYYISIPVVIFLVLAVAGSIIYGFLSAGRIPVKLTAALIICALVTVFQMIRSLFLKQQDEDPGRSLSVDEAPGLWALTREVAHNMNTRPIDEIRITPGTDLAVYERGSNRLRREDKAERILILGVGVLNGFSQNAFRAVLAHEYGHFTHRDTAGGDIALRVNADMMKFAHAMVQSGQAVWWNVAFLFLRVYHFIFRRISHGATRLQEVLADRVAVHLYGARAFKEGLSHVVRRAIEFDHMASREINDAVAVRRALQNLYELPEAPSDEIVKTIEAEVSRAINRQTTEDDTHPSPVRRFSLASRINSRNEPPAAGAVWELFADRESLTNEMSALIERRVQASAY
jgi:Zn-dependent protease with chaperone function/tetratricopeptide (TPR) repeat protein